MASADADLLQPRCKHTGRKDESVSLSLIVFEASYRGPTMVKIKNVKGTHSISQCEKLQELICNITRLSL